MNDPFASLDPIQKPKTAAERVLTSPAYSHPPPPAAPVAVAPFSGVGVGGPGHMGMGGMHMGGVHMNVGPSMGMGMGMNMGMGGGMSSGMGGMSSGMGGMSSGMGGMSSGMGGMSSGMGGMSMGSLGQPPQNPFQQQQQHAPPPQQQPVMYDNIKNLLQQKPKAPAAFEDSASMDFLENLGGGSGAFGNAKTNSGSFFPAANPQVRAAEPTSMPTTADPFGSGGFGSSPAATSVATGDIGLSIFETGGCSSNSGSSSNPVSPSSGNGSTKSSALADRLANGRRKTQEAQRSQLQLNASSFAHSGGVTGSKISLKEMVGQAPSKSTASGAPSIVSLDDFASGGAVMTSGDFGGSDPFGGGGNTNRGGSFGTTAATSSSGAVRQSGFDDSEPKPVDENDNTFW